MTYIVTENCINCKYSDCVEVCPVDCFYEASNFLVIDPEACIDCGLCVPACPADAIYAEENVPIEMIEFIEINRELSKKLPHISEKIDAPEDAKDWLNVEGKRQYLDYCMVE